MPDQAGDVAVLLARSTHISDPRHILGALQPKVVMFLSRFCTFLCENGSLALFPSLCQELFQLLQLYRDTMHLQV